MKDSVKAEMKDGGKTVPSLADMSAQLRRLAGDEGLDASQESVDMPMKIGGRSYTVSEMTDPDGFHVYVSDDETGKTVYRATGNKISVLQDRLDEWADETAMIAEWAEAKRKRMIGDPDYYKYRPVSDSVRTKAGARCALQDAIMDEALKHVHDGSIIDVGQMASELYDLTRKYDNIDDADDKRLRRPEVKHLVTGYDGTEYLSVYAALHDGEPSLTVYDVTDGKKPVRVFDDWAYSDEELQAKVDAWLSKSEQSSAADSVRKAKDSGYKDQGDWAEFADMDVDHSSPDHYTVRMRTDDPDKDFFFTVPYKSISLDEFASASPEKIRSLAKPYSPSADDGDGFYDLAEGFRHALFSNDRGASATSAEDSSGKKSEVKDYDPDEELDEHSADDHKEFIEYFKEWSRKHHIDEKIIKAYFSTVLKDPAIKGDMLKAADLLGIAGEDLDTLKEDMKDKSYTLDDFMSDYIFAIEDYIDDNDDVTDDFVDWFTSNTDEGKEFMDDFNNYLENKRPSTNYYYPEL